jgi:hypothetical protein
LTAWAAAPQKFGFMSHPPTLSCMTKFLTWLWKKSTSAAASY